MTQKFLVGHLKARIASGKLSEEQLEIAKERLEIAQKDDSFITEKVKRE